MASFLAWLYSVADRVYQWFGSAWAQLYAGALNAWTWAVTQAQAAYNNARSYAFSLFQGLQADLSGLSNWASYQLGLIQAQLANLPAFDPASILSWLSSQLAPITAAINAARAYASGLVSTAIADARAFASQLVADAIRAVQSGFAWLEAIRGQLTAFLASVTGPDLANLIQFARTLYSQLTQFFADPVKWIFDMLAADFISALCWLLAMGMGAVDDSIPNSPPWHK